MDKNSNKVEPMKSSHGGARPGGGKPKGVRWPSTLRKEEARENAEVGSDPLQQDELGNNGAGHLCEFTG
jgi:hypothetical protein